MRRRQIVKERTDGFIKEQQERARMGQPQRSGKPGEHEAVLQQGVASRQLRAGDAHERVGEPAIGHVSEGARQEQNLEINREEPWTARVQLKPGVCRHCGIHIGRGKVFHERHCRAKNANC